MSGLRSNQGVGEILYSSLGIPFSGGLRVINQTSHTPDASASSTSQTIVSLSLAERLELVADSDCPIQESSTAPSFRPPSPLMWMALVVERPT